MDDMFKPQAQKIDAVVLTAERGSAYTLLHPEYSVAVPKPRPFKVPLAYVIAGRDSAMAAMVNTWIELKRKDGTIDELFAYWILGQDAAPKRPRWSILDDGCIGRGDDPTSTNENDAAEVVQTFRFAVTVAAEALHYTNENGA